MRIGLVDVDGHNFPNLALARLSAWHKSQGDTVEFAIPLCRYDRIYMSKIFTFTPDNHDAWLCDDIRKGGTGYRDYTTKLPPEVEATPPDLSLYPQFNFAYGFLSRGCIRNCPWCVVPRKEGALRVVEDIEHLSQGRRIVRLMDNNFLANDKEWVIDQLHKAQRLKLRLDFNQALDARLVTPEIAKELAATKWAEYIRFSCDTDQVLERVIETYEMIHAAGYTKEFMTFVLAKDLSVMSRIEKLLAAGEKGGYTVTPFVMPYRNLDGDGSIISAELKHLARWCNRPWFRKTCTFQEYMKGKTI